ncbi:response regulator [Candidatus Saccharibacteria bacterium]|nr:response regulator [Candidatus Saccharibacteria bacterium]
MQDKKILIVEDEPSLLNVMYDKFMKEGYSVFKANNGKEGLKLALKEKPHLILLDIDLPIMNGLEMLKDLRKHKDCKNTEVIIITNYENSDMVADTMLLGVHEYLVKSDWRLEDIVKTIKNKIG